MTEQDLFVREETLDSLAKLLKEKGPKSHEHFDDYHRRLGRDFTEELAEREAHGGLLPYDMQRTFGACFAEGGKVVEIGPGAKDILYSELADVIHRMDISWIAIDINDDVVLALQENALNNNWTSNYYIVQANLNKKAWPLASESVNNIAGICCLDEMSKFGDFIPEAKRVLVPKGYMQHAQDLPPSDVTILYLILEDEQFQKAGRVRLYGPFGVSFDIFGVQFPSPYEKRTASDFLNNIFCNPFLNTLALSDPIIPAKHYLHMAIAKKFSAYGFRIKNLEMRTFSGTSLEHCSLYECLTGQDYMHYYSLLRVQKHK